MCTLILGKNNVGISGKGEQRKTVTVEYTDRTREMRIIIIINEIVLSRREEDGSYKII